MFNAIWRDRAHVSELSGKPLLPQGHSQWHWQFLHVLPKGVYTKWKLESDNIMLALPDEHSNQEQYPEFLERQDQLRRQYLEQEDGKKFD